jgi:hypothetical protein
MEEWKGRLPGSFGFLFRSNGGRLTSSGFVLSPNDQQGLPNDWWWESWSSPNHEQRIVGVPPWPRKGMIYPWGFNEMKSTSSWVLMLPYWFLVLAIGSLAIICQMRRPLRRFNLRSLFTVTTFLAIVLGLIAWLDRPWIGK